MSGFEVRWIQEHGCTASIARVDQSIDRDTLPENVRRVSFDPLSTDADLQ